MTTAIKNTNATKLGWDTPLSACYHQRNLRGFVENVFVFASKNLPVVLSVAPWIFFSLFHTEVNFFSWVISFALNYSYFKNIIHGPFQINLEKNNNDDIGFKTVTVFLLFITRCSDFHSCRCQKEEFQFTLYENSTRKNINMKYSNEQCAQK